MNITNAAMRIPRLTLAASVLVLLAGILTFISFPSQEEPTITVRQAMVSVGMPNLPTEKVESMLAKPVEESLRSISGIKTITTTVRPGSATIELLAFDEVEDLPALWQRVRAKAAEAQALLPEGSSGPYVDDDFGRVAVASIAITAEGFEASEMREPIRKLRESLFTVSGTENVTVIGLPEEQVYLSFDDVKMTAQGLTPAMVVRQLQDRNVIATGGVPVAASLAMTVQVTGELASLDDIKRFQIRIGGDSDPARFVPLSALADVSVTHVDPPTNAAVYKGKRAVVVAVSMAAGQSVEDYGKRLRGKLDETAGMLPAGFEQHIVTYQADVVAREMGRMNHVMVETVVIVMAVVMLFLGWRTGLIVGAIVPLTILGSLILMRMAGVELQTVSIAAVILALGLLVDNGIVIAEDIERRIEDGQDRRQACIDAGTSLATPLLTSTLVIVLAFSPFFFGQTSTNEYMRSLAIVLATTLMMSWLLSLTVTPLLCFYFIKVKGGHGDQPHAYDGKFYTLYKRAIGWLLTHRLIYVSAMVALLALAALVLGTRPYNFLPKSDRLQFQVPLTLAEGTDSGHTLATVEELSKWMADSSQNPEITDSIGYVADGGPRIVLGLNPPLPGPNIGYFTVSVKDGTDIDKVIARVRDHVLSAHPDVRAEPKRFSLGATESGVAVYRVVGHDEAILRDTAWKLEAMLRSVPGTRDIKNDWGPRIPRLVVDVDPVRASAAGVTTQDVSQALQVRFGGAAVTQVHDNSTVVPVMLGNGLDQRGQAGRIADVSVFSSNGARIPLAGIADIRTDSEPSVVSRRNLERAITVTGTNDTLTAGEMIETLSSAVEAIELPPGYRIELGGEIEDSAEANDALLGFLPHAVVAILLIFIWQFNSFRKVFIVVGSIPFVMIGAALALLVTMQPFGFMPTFGLLALAGIIVNNAVLLLEKIEEEIASGVDRKQAVINAAVMRLRPIVMTKLTCILGLIPLMLFAGSLWTGLAITMIGGLALGTLVTLGLIPVLYELLFDYKQKKREPGPSSSD